MLRGHRKETSSVYLGDWDLHLNTQKKCKITRRHRYEDDETLFAAVFTSLDIKKFLENLVLYSLS